MSTYRKGLAQVGGVINIEGSDLMVVKTEKEREALKGLKDKQRVMVYDPSKDEIGTEYVWYKNEWVKVTCCGQLVEGPGGKPGEDGKPGESGGTTIIESKTIVVKDLEERDALEGLELDDRVIVLDASDDENVAGKVAEYLYRPDDEEKWVLLSKQGRDGIDGEEGDTGPQGPKGDPFLYEHFTDEQLEALKGPPGEDGANGKDGRDGEDASSLVVIDNEKQLELLDPEEKDRVYIRDNEVEYVYIDGKWKKLGGSGSDSKEVRAKDVITDTSLQFISKGQKELIKVHDKLLEELQKEVSEIEINPPSDGKVKIYENDELGFLNEKIGETITVENNLLEVIKLLGQIVTVDDINQLDGVKDNVQKQIDALSRVGNFTGSVDNKSELNALQDPGLNDMVIVLEDEDHDGESTIYMYNGTDWEYVGKFNIKLDDIEAEDIKIKDTQNKFPVSKNVEAALAYLANKYDDVALEVDDLKECCDNNTGGGSGGENGEGESDSGGVLQVPRRKDLPEEGSVHTAYIVDEDETNNKSTSLYIWQVDPKTEKGAYVLLITATVGGKMQEYQQVTKLSVVAPRMFEMPIPRTQNFLRAPIEVLSFSKGKQNVKVDAVFNNKSADDFHDNPEFKFTDVGFTLSDTLHFEGVKHSDCEDGIIQEIDLAGVHIGKKITEVF